MPWSTRGTGPGTPDRYSGDRTPMPRIKRSHVHRVNARWTSDAGSGGRAADGRRTDVARRRPGRAVQHPRRERDLADDVAARAHAARLVELRQQVARVGTAGAVGALQPQQVQVAGYGGDLGADA